MRLLLTPRREARPLRTHTRRDRRGATVVELAVVSPVFFVLIFGLVEFSRVMMVRDALSDAARAGCRKAAIITTTNSGQAEDVVRDYLSAFIASANDQSACRVTISPGDLSNIAQGTEITATVEVNCSDVSWVPLGYMENEVLRAQATMKRE